MQKLLLFTALIAVTCAKQFGNRQKSTDGLCTFNNKDYKPGDEWFSSDCKKWKCVKGSRENEMILEGESCDYDTTKGRDCEAKIIPDKNYPECCSKTEVVCGKDRPRHFSLRVERAAGGYDRRESETARMNVALNRLNGAQDGSAPTLDGYKPNTAGVNEAFGNFQSTYAGVLAAREEANRHWGNNPNRNRLRAERAAGGHDRRESETARMNVALNKLNGAQDGSAPTIDGYKPNTTGVNEAFGNFQSTYAGVLAAREEANRHWGNNPNRNRLRAERAAGGYDRRESETARMNVALNRLNGAQDGSAPTIDGYRPNTAGVNEAFGNFQQTYAGVLAAREEANRYWGNDPNRDARREYRRRHH